MRPPQRRLAEADRERFEYVDPRRAVCEEHDPEPFDRIAFAMRVLRILRPERMTVVLYERSVGLRIERGRDLRYGPGATCALVGIPPHATRQHIAYALAELARVANVPFAVDLLLHAGVQSD